ncbi:MAG: hypothetical protein Q8L55_04700 [Phycisphaerales bacterium]|nr:hypothetical protein [Phycisphaerales bacterium]
MNSAPRSTQTKPPSGREGFIVMLRRRVVPWLQVIGLLLLALAVYLVIGQKDLLSNAWASLKSAPAWQIVAVVTLPVANWLIVTLLFHALTNHCARVRLGEMTALIGSAWLLNIIPGRPGLMGRVAYHKLVNRMNIKDCVMVIMMGIAANGVAIALALLLIGATFLGGSILPQELSVAYTPRLLIFGAAATLAMILSVAWLQHGSRPVGTGPMTPWRFTFAVAMRYADYLVWIARYWLAFSVIGIPITLTEAAAVAAVSQLVQLLPVQLGPREWAVGLAGTFLPSLRPAAASTTVNPVTGLTADLLNRAAELAVSLPVGLVCTWWVFRAVRRAERAQPVITPSGR